MSNSKMIQFRTRQKQCLLGMVLLMIFCFSQIANSQTKIEYGALENQDEKEIGPSPVKVAIIDSNFNGARLENIAGTVEAYSVVSNSVVDVTDDIVTAQGDILEHNNDHGTKVLQEFLNGYGMNDSSYDPNILLIKISSNNDDEGKVSSVRVAKGIRYAADNGAKVINISLGTLKKTENVLAELAYAHDKGVIVIAASGNWGENKDIPKEKMSIYAQSQDVIAVGSMDDDGSIAPYTSGRGNDKLEFLARTRFGIGTSLAAPIITANVARILENKIEPMDDENNNGSWDLEEVKKALTNESNNPGTFFKAV